MYRIFLSILLLSFLGFYTWEKISSNHDAANFLYQGSVDLREHILQNYAKKSKQKSVFFLGSSAVSGNNIPIKTTTSDYFNIYAQNMVSFNLATMEANVVVSFYYYLLGLKYIHPEFVLVGISPDFLDPRPTRSVALYKNLSLLKTFLPADIYKSLDWELKKTGLGLASFLNTFSSRHPHENVLQFWTWLFYMKEKIYGPTMLAHADQFLTSNIKDVANSQNPKFEILRILKNVVENNGGKLIAFLEPHYRPYEIMGEIEFNKYLNTVKNKLNEFNIPFFDYTFLNPPSAEYFTDFIHMTPKGNEALAGSLLRDLKRFTSALEGSHHD